MTLELINAATDLRRKYSREFFEKALELAQVYGWRPLGTRLIRTPDEYHLRMLWNGAYLTNDGQTVLAEDALGLAQALQRALDDVPNESTAMDWNLNRWREDDDLPEWFSPAERVQVEEGLMAYAPAGMELHPFEFFAGAEKPYLVELIRFCKLGSFRIC
jgi:hypothetical protein